MSVYLDNKIMNKIQLYCFIIGKKFFHLAGFQEIDRAWDAVTKKTSGIHFSRTKSHTVEYYQQSLKK